MKTMMFVILIPQQTFKYRSVYIYICVTAPVLLDISGLFKNHKQV